MCCLGSTFLCCWDILQLQASLKSPLLFLPSQPKLHLSSCQADGLHTCMYACRSNHLHSCKHLGVRFLCFILCRSTKLLSMCNTQLGLRYPGSLQDSVQLVLGHKVPYWNGHPLPFSPYEVQQSEIRDVTSKGILVGWCSTFV